MSSSTPNQTQHLPWKVRPATPADASAATQLLQNCYRALLPEHYDNEELLTKALPYIATARSDLLTCGTWYVVEHHSNTGLLVGCGGWTSTTPLGGEEVPHLRHFATDPDHLRQGIARALWDQCWNDICQHYNNQPPTMEVYSTLTAESFYASLGFEPVKRINLPLGPDCDFPAILMKRQTPGSKTPTSTTTPPSVQKRHQGS